MFPPTPVEMRQLGDSLRHMREAAGLSLRETARRSGISHTTLGRVERGERVAATDTLERVRDVIAAELTTHHKTGGAA